MERLSPFVYWAQTEKTISLKIDLKNVSVPSAKVVNHNNIKFSAQGVGAKGDNKYQFDLDLYSSIKKDEAVNVRVYDNRVEVILEKETPTWWPRLTAQQQKPAWLKVNFDLWKSEDLQDSDDEKRDVMQDYPNMYDRLQKEELGYRKEDKKTVYLIIYNLFQFIGFTYVLTVMSMRYSQSQHESIADTYENVGSMMKFLQQLQYLEVLHVLFRYTKGSVLTTFLQVSGRAFILFAMIEAEPRMQTKPVVFYLFLMWCLIEIVRYPFYITQLYKREIYILTWLRYTIWIPLYPLGVICEAVTVLRNIPYFEETGKFSIGLPNSWNFAFDMPTFMRIYLLVVIFPGMVFLMRHMAKLRKIKLKPKIVIKKSY